MIDLLVFTDLDGSLLNDDYSYQEALPTLRRLRNRNIPVIMVSSKTYLEVRELSLKILAGYPYICENGCLIVFPEDTHYLAVGISGTKSYQGSELVVNRGESREFILSVLRILRNKYTFTGFSDMSETDIAESTGLSKADAEKANRRVATEPIVWTDTQENIGLFRDELDKNKLRLVKGGRFYHVMGMTDKANAVSDLLKSYRAHGLKKAHSIVLGDSDNDVSMLESADTAVILPMRNGKYLQLRAQKSTVYATEHAAKGWASSIDNILDKLGDMRNKEE